MNTQAAQNFFGLLTLIANALTLVVAVVAIMSVTPTGRRLRDRFAAAVGGGVLGLLTLVAVTTMLGSLYFSEVAGFTPCRFCWFARICLYPLTALFIVALCLRGRSSTVRPFAVPFAVAAILVSGYHYLIEWYPTLEGATSCDLSAPCTAVWFRSFGFISLAYMSISSGAAVLAGLWLWRRYDLLEDELLEDELLEDELGTRDPNPQTTTEAVKP